MKIRIRRDVARVCTHPSKSERGGDEDRSGDGGNSV